MEYLSGCKSKDRDMEMALLNIGAEEILRVVAAAEHVLTGTQANGKAYQTASVALQHPNLRQARP